MLSAQEKVEQVYLQNSRVIVRIWTSSANLIIKGAADVGHISVEIEASKKYMSLWPFQGSSIRNPETGEYQNKEPALEKANPWTELFSGVEAQDLTEFTYEQDLALEENFPDIVLCFYSLSTLKIEEAYDRIVQTHGGQKWALFGLGSAKNCASFAYGLLRDGGLDNFYTLPDRLVSSSRVTGNSSSAASQGLFKSSSSSITGQSGSDLSSALGASFFAAEALVSPFIDSPDILVQKLTDAKKNELDEFAKKGKLHLIPKFEGETKISIDLAPTAIKGPGKS